MARERPMVATIHNATLRTDYGHVTMTERGQAISQKSSFIRERQQSNGEYALKINNTTINDMSECVYLVSHCHNVQSFHGLKALSRQWIRLRLKE